MAKKKTESASERPAEKKAAAPVKAAAPKAPAKAKKAAKPQPATSSPMIDTGLAAENAARMIMAGTRPAQVSDDNAQPKKESSTFTKLKESLAKPHINSGNPLLNNLGGAGNKNKPNFFGGKQVGHNQTFGSGSSRSVPRRTSG